MPRMPCLYCPAQSEHRPPVSGGAPLRMSPLPRVRAVAGRWCSALLLAVLAAACPAVAAAPDDRSTATVVAALRDIPDGFSEEGVVEAVVQSTVAAQLTGRIVSVSVDAGDRVKRGQRLMRIDPRESVQNVAAARAQVAQAQAGLENARMQYQRTRDLKAQGFVAPAALDRALADYKAAAAQLESARAAANSADTSRGFTDILAPFDGTVLSRQADLGEMATPGRPLLTLYDPVRLRVSVTVPQYRMSALARPIRAQILLQGQPAAISPATVVVVPGADSRTHATQVRLNLPEGYRDAYPGLFARARFVVGTRRQLTVPEGAIVRRSEVTAVYVLTGHRPELRQVRLGSPTEDGAVEILAGLVPGEQVALDPARAGIALRQPDVPTQTRP